jgi:nicotinamide riboside kinase
MKKIAIIGAHSCGKTTMAYEKAFELKCQDKSVAIIMEQARLCPYPLDTADAAEWMILSQILAEKTAERGHEYIICDRTAFDSIIYAAVNEISLPDYIIALAKAHLSSYDEIIHLAPSRPIFNDGFRDTDEEYREKVAKGFESVFGPGVQYFKKTDVVKEIPDNKETT